MSMELTEEMMEDIKLSNIDVEEELMNVLKTEIMTEFAKEEITQKDIDRPFIDAILKASGKKIRIDVEEIQKMRARRKELNRFEVTEMEFYYKNEKITPTQEELESWRFTGLNSIDFVEYIIEPIYINKE